MGVAVRPMLGISYEPDGPTDARALQPDWSITDAIWVLVKRPPKKPIWFCRYDWTCLQCGYLNFRHGRFCRNGGCRYPEHGYNEGHAYYTGWNSHNGRVGMTFEANNPQ